MGGGRLAFAGHCSHDGRKRGAVSSGLLAAKKRHTASLAWSAEGSSYRSPPSVGNEVCSGPKALGLHPSPRAVCVGEAPDGEKQSFLGGCRVGTCLPSAMQVDDGSIETLKAIVGEGVPDDTLRALLLRSGGDVAAAANSFFDGGAASLGGGDAGGSFQSSTPAVGDDVLGTLFKTLEDQGRKLAGTCREHAAAAACGRGGASLLPAPLQ